MADAEIENPLGRRRRPRVRGSILFGFVTLAAFFGGFGAWGGLAPMESAAVAMGSVAVDTNKKLIQHLEGGIVADILVREADEVKAGQVLIRLDTTQVKARIDLIKARIQSDDQQVKLIDEEIATVEQEFRRGNATKPRLLALQRRKAELEGSKIENLAQLRAAEDTLARAEIRAPIAGTVVDLKVTTSGGVIKAGDPLLFIVPRDLPLVIDAVIDPNDIDVVRAGLSAHVRLTPYNARFLAPIPAKVAWISRDRLLDPRTNQHYYSARIDLLKKPSEIDKSIVLQPGMPAEVIIVTGERTMLDYMLAPLVRSFRRSMRED